MQSDRPDGVRAVPRAAPRYAAVSICIPAVPYAASEAYQISPKCSMQQKLNDGQKNKRSSILLAWVTCRRIKDIQLLAPPSGYTGYSPSGPAAILASAPLAPP